MRVHEFTKVEQYVICKNSPEESEKWHRQLLQTSEAIVQDLGLPYRIVECCTGDMGTGKVRMYDIECWVPSEKKYRETHSCSRLHDCKPDVLRPVTGTKMARFTLSIRSTIPP